MLRNQEQEQQEQQKQKILDALNECTDKQEFDRLQEQLFNLNVQIKTDKEEYEGKVSTALKSLSELKIEFSKLMASNVYSVDDVKAYAEEKGWINAAPMVSTQGDKLANAEAKKKTKSEPKESLIVGTFNFADYGFEMPKNAKGEPMGNETSLDWDFNKRYGGLSWQNKFIKAITSKGYEHVLEKSTPEFKDWVNTPKTSKRGGGDIYENKRDFLASFGMKPADADKINFGAEEGKGEAQATSHTKKKK